MSLVIVTTVICVGFVVRLPGNVVGDFVPIQTEVDLTAGDVEIDDPQGSSAAMVCVDMLTPGLTHDHLDRPALHSLHQ